jgi:hypothetical protein
LTVQLLEDVPVEPLLVELQLTDPLDEYFVSVTPLLVAEQEEPDLPPEGRGKIDLLVLGFQMLNPLPLKKLFRSRAPLTCSATTPTTATRSTPASAKMVLLLLFCIPR